MSLEGVSLSKSSARASRRSSFLPNLQDVVHGPTSKLRSLLPGTCGSFGAVLAPVFALAPGNRGRYPLQRLIPDAPPVDDDDFEGLSSAAPPPRADRDFCLGLANGSLDATSLSSYVDEECAAIERDMPRFFQDYGHRAPPDFGVAAVMPRPPSPVALPRLRAKVDELRGTQELRDLDDSIVTTNRSNNRRVRLRVARRAEDAAAAARWRARAGDRRDAVRRAHRAQIAVEERRVASATMRGRRERRLARERAERRARDAEARVLGLELVAVAVAAAHLALKLKRGRPLRLFRRQVAAARVILGIVRGALARRRRARSTVVVRFFCREMSIIFKLRHGCMIGKRALRLITTCGTRAITTREARAARLRNQFEGANDRRVTNRAEINQ